MSPAAPAATTVTLPLSTRGAQIVDATGTPVVLQGVNWFGLETANHAPHGLWTRDYRDMLAQIKAGLIAAGSDAVTATQQTYMVLHGMLLREATMVAFVWLFRVLGAVFLAVTGGEAPPRGTSADAYPAARRLRRSSRWRPAWPRAWRSTNTVRWSLARKPKKGQRATSALATNEPRIRAPRTSMSR